MHFTSLSPDGQPISLAIVTNDLCSPCIDNNLKPNDDCENCSGEWHKGSPSSSFYAEFSDFDINRCDDWVKENVISKLRFKNNAWGKDAFVEDLTEIGSYIGSGKTEIVKHFIKKWLSQFSSYQLNFIVDCGWFTWYKFVELMGEWEIQRTWEIRYALNTEIEAPTNIRVGLPKLPPNFPPVPEDLNELIAFTKNISISEAFDFDREIIAYGRPELSTKERYNALWDAKVTKDVYNKLFKHR